MAKPCKVTYGDKKYSIEEFLGVLHDGLLDQMVRDNIIDVKQLTKKPEIVERTEFDSQEDAELYEISREADPNVIAAKYFTLPTAEEANFKDYQIMEYLGSKGKIRESDWARYNDLNSLTPEIRRRYIDSTNKSAMELDSQAEELQEQLEIPIEPSDFADVILEYGNLEGFKRKSRSDIEQALLERYSELTGKNQITDAAAKKGYDAVKKKEKADRERKLTPKEQLEEIGVTEQDIAQAEEFAAQGFGEAGTPLEQKEFTINEKRRLARKKADDAENDLLSFVSKSRGQFSMGANALEFAVKLGKVFKAYAELGIVTLEGAIARMREKAGDDFVNENIEAIKDAFKKFDLQKENVKDRAKELFAEHKELVKKAKEAKEDGVNSLSDFVEYLEEPKTKEIESAWRELITGEKKKLADFTEIAEKEGKDFERERAKKIVSEGGGVRLDDFAGETESDVSNDFESTVFTNIESGEFRDTLSNKPRESGRELTEEEKIYAAEGMINAIQLGANIVEAAKQEFGDNYVNGLLGYVSGNSNKLGPDKVSLILVSLENDLNKQLLEDPSNETLIKQEKMVQDIAIAYMRSVARGLSYGRLRQLARIGYDVDAVTSQFFTSGQSQAKSKVKAAVEADADTINDEAELQEQESETGELFEEADVPKRTAKQIKADISDTIKRMREDLIKASRGGAGTFATIPGAIQIKAITPHVIKLSKLLTELGGLKAKEIISEIKKQIKDVAPDVTESDISNIINETRNRKNYINRLRKDLEDLDAQIEAKKKKVVSKEDKYKTDEEIKNLRDEKQDKQKQLSELDPGYAAEVKLKNDLATAQRSLDEYERRIKENDFVPAAKPSQSQIDQKLQDLRDKRDAAKETYQAKKKAYEQSLVVPRSVEEVELENNIKSAEKSIAELERKLAEKDFGKDSKNESLWTEELGKLRQKQAELRKRLKEERDALKPVSTPKTRLEVAKENIKKRIEEKKTQIANRVKELKTRNVLTPDTELQALRQQEKQLNEELNKYLTPEAIASINEAREKSIVKKIESEIESLDQQIKNGEKVQKDKKEPISTPEIELLRAKRKAKVDFLNELDPEPKSFAKQALIDAGYGREITVTLKDGTKETRQILDWKKLAGAEGSVDNIKRIVEQALKDKGFSQAQISRMQDAFKEQYDNLRADVIEKSLKELERSNIQKTPSERKSSAKRLAELYNMGLFDQNADDFDYLINKAIGLSDIGQEAFFEAKNLAKSLSQLYTMNSNEFFTKQFIRGINQKITKLLNKVALNEGNNWFKFTTVTSEIFNLMLRAKLQTVKQFLDNQISGRQERLIQDIGSMFSKELDTKELKALRVKYASTIKDDITKNAGLYFGEINSPFLTKSQIEDYINSRTDNQFYHLVVSSMLGKSYLEGADSLNKAASTEKIFIAALLKVMTDKTNPNRMTPEEALKFINEQVTGQKFKDALIESENIINAINQSAGKTVLATTKENIYRGAMDLVKANLLVGQALDIKTIEASYNAAYKVAGFGLGHEANNPVSKAVNKFQSYLEEDIKRAVKEKQWGKAANLTLISTINRNFINPFVGGGTNWLVLGFQKSGLDVISPLAFMAQRMKEGVDLSSPSGVAKLEQQLVDDFRIKTLSRRLLIGGTASALITLSLFASGGDEEFEKWLKKNEWARKYQSVFTPQLTLLLMYAKNKNLGKFFIETFAKSAKFSKTPDIIKGFNEYNKDTAPSTSKALGIAGSITGSFFDTPVLPVRFVRDLGGIYKGILDKPQERPDFGGIGFWNGFWNYGAIDMVGLRPDRTYMKNVEEFIPSSDEKSIEFLRDNKLKVEASSDKPVIINGTTAYLNESQAQKYDEAFGKTFYSLLKENFDKIENLSGDDLKDAIKYLKDKSSDEANKSIGVLDEKYREITIDSKKYILSPEQINDKIKLEKSYIKMFGKTEESLLKSSLKMEKKSNFDISKEIYKSIKSSSESYAEGVLESKYLNFKGEVKLMPKEEPIKD